MSDNKYNDYYSNKKRDYDDENEDDILAGIEFLDDDTEDVQDDDDDDDDYEIEFEEQSFDDRYDENGRYHSEGKQSKRESTTTTLRAEIFSYVKIIILAVIIAFIFTQYVIVNAEVPTGSMKNTINEHDRLIGYRLSYLFSDPERGDVVIFRFPDNEAENYVKRIIGIPGDVVRIANGHVYVNDVLQDEPYLREPMIPEEAEVVYTVPDECYFMMGDNRNSSWDSRRWTNTFVSRKKIIAKVGFRYFNGDSKHIDFKLVK
jgi:signal peptidase I